MNKDIENIDQMRMLYLKWHIVGFVIFMVLMLVRHFFRLSGLNEQLVGKIVLAGLIMSVIIQAVFVLLSALLENEIRTDPHLKNSLHNELVQSINLQAWIAAYIGAAGITVLFAITGFFYPLCDPMTISLSAITMGAGAQRIYFYTRYKNL